MTAPPARPHRVARPGRTRRTAPAAEQGFTLLELLIAMGIGVVVITLVMMSLGLYVQTGDNGVAMGQADSNADLVLAQIQREIVGTNVIFNPATEGTNAGTGIPPGFSLRVLTAAAGQTTCVQWRVLGSGAGPLAGDLQTRSWPNGEPSKVTQWSTIATGVDNAATQPPFVLDTTSGYGHRLLDVDLVIRAAHTPRSDAVTQVRASFSALDAEFFSPTDRQFCTPVPSP